MAADNKQEREKISSKGGKSQGKEDNPGNFANRKDASEAGRKGGEK